MSSVLVSMMPPVIYGRALADLFVCAHLTSATRRVGSRSPLHACVNYPVAQGIATTIRATAGRVAAATAGSALGPAVASYGVLVTGAYTGSLAVTARTLAGAVAPGSYTISAAARNACGTGPATPAQTVVVP